MRKEFTRKTRHAVAALIAASAIGGAAAPAHAATTVYNFNGDTSPTLGWATIGQSLTALDDYLFFAVGLRVANPDLGDFNFTAKLFEGEGYGGTLLTTKNLTAPSDLPESGGSSDYGFGVVDFYDVMLTVGQSYTVQISADSYKLAGVMSLTDEYDGGRAFFDSTLPVGTYGELDGCRSASTCETVFSATFYGDSTGAVPEPATWALMIGGFGLAGTMLRRRKAAAISL